MINLNELLHDDDFCCTYQIVRKTTTWTNGRPVYEDTTINVEGIVAPSSSKDIEMIPEADRRHGLKTFYADFDKHLNVSNMSSYYDSSCFFFALRNKTFVSVINFFYIFEVN